LLDDFDQWRRVVLAMVKGVAHQWGVVERSVLHSPRPRYQSPLRGHPNRIECLFEDTSVSWVNVALAGWPPNLWW
jgi:hypothetical protein